MSRTMKDSGIEWIGDVPEEWEVTKFYRVCSVITDFVASGSFADLRENVPYLSEPDYAMLVRTTDLAKTARSEGKVYISKASYEFLSNSNLFGGEIVLPNIGSIGDVYVVPKLYERMSLAPNSIMFKTRYCDKYYYYYFLSKVGGLQLSEISQSTAMAKFNKTDLKQIRVFLPSLAEQQRIAEFLDRKCSEIDSLIDLQEQMIEELKAYKQSVITEAVTKGLNPAAPMRDSGIEWIGQIPEHWEVCRVKDCLQNTKNNLRVGPFGSALSGNDICDTGEYWIYNQRTVLDSNFSTNNSFVTKEKFNELESFKVFPNDILITTRGSIGKIAIVPLNAPIGILHPCIIRFVIDESKYNSRLLKRIFNESDFVLKQLRYQSNSTTIEVIYSYTLRNITLPNIPIDEQQAIADYLDKKCGEIDELITIKQQKIESLKEYKKSVIYEYVTGKKEP